MADDPKDRPVESLDEARARRAADRVAARYRDRDPARLEEFVEEQAAMEDTTGAPVTAAVQQAIEDRGLSLYELARRTGVDHGALSRFLRGERTLTLESVDKLAAELRLTVRHRRPRKSRS